MTMVSDGRSYWPNLPIAMNSITDGLTVGSITLDSTTDVIAWVGTYSGANDSIASIKVNTNFVASTAGSNIDVRIETVTNGRPTGTLWSANGTGANPRATITVVAAGATQYTATLTNAAALVAGDEFAIVLRYIAGADDGTFSIPFTNMNTTLVASVYPLILQDTGAGTWTELMVPFAWVVTMTTAGVVCWPGMVPINNSGTQVSVNNGASNDERALRFQTAAKRRVIGIRANIGNVAAGGDFQFCLWSSTGDEVGEELAQTSKHDGDTMIATTTDGWVERYFTAPYTVAANTTYYAGVKSLAAANAQLGQFTVAAAADMAGFPLGSTFAQCYLSTRTWDESQTPDLAGAWSDSTTTLPLIQLITDQIDDGTGTGGGGIRMAGHGGLAA